MRSLSTVVRLLGAACAVTQAAAATPTAADASPTVTLDYTTLVPALGNSTLGFYKYQNVRYAAIPTGSLRWAEPQWPPVETAVNAGKLAAADVSCATTEDCLFMDIWVPANPTKKSLPVMVWQYGGGFSIGSKTQQAATQTTPEGLFALTQDFIFVSFNYRLGIAGLATGPTFNHGGGISNAGLYDTQHGFQWVRRYISAFGGDPDQVTAVGHSAGGSSILFQMTRFGGRAEQLFARAYIQSPGYWAGAGHWSAEQFWLNVSALAGCSGGSVSCMRNVAYNKISTAATTAVGSSGYVFQPKVDGKFVADIYEAQFYQKNFNFSGPFVITHHLHEENSTPYARISSTKDIVNYLHVVFPAMTDQAINQMLALYPEASYASAGLRMSDIAQSIEITARNLAVTNALGNNTWNGEAIMAPATHMTDQSYYWYGTNKLPVSSSPFAAAAEAAVQADPNASVNIAVVMQKYLLSFVITGDPNKMWSNDTGKIYWPKYNERPESMGTTILFNTSSCSLGGDDLANERSLFWNKALWY